jgi:hypothetical protein
VYGKVTGTQPDGTITISRSSRRSLPGHEPHGYISVSYDFPDGTQTVNEFITHSLTNYFTLGTYFAHLQHISAFSPRYHHVYLFTNE